MTLKISIISIKTIWKGCSIYEKKEIVLDFRYVKPGDIVAFLVALDLLVVLFYYHSYLDRL
jgi:hypothetical protein